MGEIVEHPIQIQSDAQRDKIQTFNIQGTFISTPDTSKLVDVTAKRVALFPHGLKGAQLFALDADVQTSEWTGEAVDANLSRDDNLLTTWSCTLEKRCALSLAFKGQEVDARVIRLFSGVGSNTAEHRSSPRIKTLRIHTGQGWIESSLPNYWDHHNIMLSKSLRLKNLSIEVMETYGEEKNTIGVTEIEVFGTKGPRRQPMKIDSELIVFRGSPQFVHHRGATIYDVFPTWVEELDEEGTPRRLFRGSGIYASKSGRFFLVERLTGFSCPGSTIRRDGRHMLVDLETRAFIAVGPFRSEGPIEIWRHRDGNGFARCYQDAEGPWMSCDELLINDDGRLKIERQRFADYGAGSESHLKAKGFAIRKTGLKGSAGSPKTHKVTYKTAIALLKGSYTPSAEKIEEYQNSYWRWEKTALGDRHFVLYEVNDCGDRYQTALIRNDGNKLLILRGGDHVLRPLSNSDFLLQIGRSIHRFSDDGELELLIEGAELYGFSAIPYCSEC